MKTENDTTEFKMLYFGIHEVFMNLLRLEQRYNYIHKDFGGIELMVRIDGKFFVAFVCDTRLKKEERIAYYHYDDIDSNPFSETKTITPNKHESVFKNDMICMEWGLPITVVNVPRKLNASRLSGWLRPFVSQWEEEEAHEKVIVDWSALAEKIMADFPIFMEAVKYRISLNNIFINSTAKQL